MVLAFARSGWGGVGRIAWCWWLWLGWDWLDWLVLVAVADLRAAKKRVMNYGECLA